MMRINQKEQAAIILIGDISAMCIAVVFALALGHRQPFSLYLLHYYRWGIAAIFISVVVIFFILDAYSLHKVPVRFIHQVLYLAGGLLLSAALDTFIFFLFRNTIPRAVFILFFIVSFGLVVLFRYIISILTISSVYWNILLVGQKKISLKIAELINSRKYLRARVVGYASIEPVNPDLDHVFCLGPLDSLISILDREDIQQIIVTTSQADQKLNRLLLECMKRKVKIADFKQVMEDVAGIVPIDHLDENWFILELSRYDRRYYWYGKRLLDFLLSSIGLCIGAPFFLLAALAIKLDSKGPVFYSQTRIGRDNVPFRVWKLRTMVRDADKNNMHWTIDNDARITRVGKLLRMVRLDELPQLVNILKGEMSLIGPRPEAASLVEKYAKEIPYYLYRHMVTPGITGWAQINYGYGNSILDTREKLKYDYFYIKNRSITLDLVIFLRTIRIVVTCKGAL